MNEFSEGDLIEATKGDTVIRGRVIRPGTTDRLALPILEESPVDAPFTRWLEDHGWTLTLIEKAAPALPTEPGWYLDAEDDVWLLRENQTWSNQGEEHAREIVATAAPFTRLEPVADTAKKVLDAVETFAWADGFEPQIAALRKQFGVKDD